MNGKMGLDTLPLAAVSDALDLVGFDGQCRGIKPLDRGFRLWGEAFTVAYGPLDESRGDQTVGDFIDEVPEGAVVVIANGGRRDCTVWGDILTLTARGRGVAGTIIDGVARDSRASIELGYPVFALGSYMRTGKGRAAIQAIQQPVEIGGALVSPGDLVLGSADGVVIIPKRLRREVLRLANRIEEVETDIRSAVLRGVPLAEARGRFGYHQLAAGGEESHGL